MKKKLIYILTGCLLIATSCEQELIDLQDPPLTPPDTSCEDATAGTLDLTKFIALGNSFVAGVQGGALFTSAQDNSLAAIVNRQLECAGADADFVQPDINATLGWNLFLTQPVLSDPTKPVLGKLLLQYGTNVSCATSTPTPRPTPQAYAVGNLEAVPNPSVNPGFMYTATTTSELNNFSVPAVTLGQFLTPAAGNWGNPNPAVGFSPFYGRFASVPGTSTILSDAATSGGTLALVWAGMDDFMLYAAFGADPTAAPLTSSGDFATRLGAIFGHPSIGLFTINPDMKAVVGNFPDIFKMPHFTAVTYNPIPLTQTDVDQLTAGFAGYNQVLDGIIGNATLLANFGLSAEELTARKVSFTASCTNKILLVDETLDDLGNVFDYLRSINVIDSDAKRTALIPYEQVRQSTADDVIPFATGSILGTAGSFGLLGVSEPVSDRYVIIPSEKTEINNARAAYNATITGIAANFATKLVVADVDAEFTSLTTAGAKVLNGVTITPRIDPPTGIYSEDGLHPNTRGYAYISRVFINALNTKFGASIPLTSIADYSATALPIP